MLTPHITIPGGCRPHGQAARADHGAGGHTLLWRLLLLRHLHPPGAASQPVGRVVCMWCAWVGMGMVCGPTGGPGVEFENWEGCKIDQTAPGVPARPSACRTTSTCPPDGGEEHTHLRPWHITVTSHETRAHAVAGLPQRAAPDGAGDQGIWGDGTQITNNKTHLAHAHNVRRTTRTCPP